MMAINPATQGQIALILGLSTRQIREHTSAGMPTVMVDERRRYPVPECVAWYVNRKIVHERARTSDERATRAALLDRKLGAETGLAELQLDQRRATVVPMDYLEQQVTAILLQMRSALRSMPGVFAPRIVGLKSVPDAQLALQAIVDEMLTALSQMGDDPALDDDEEIDDDAQLNGVVPT
jgi:hypothetical protein